METLIGGDMKDSLLLLLTGIVCAAGAWLFFRYFGQEAFGMLMLLGLIGAIADNARLRRRLRERGAKPEGKRTWL
jgi:hypothetical protein